MKKYRHLKDLVVDEANGETICKCCGRVVEEKQAVTQMIRTGDEVEKIQHGASETNVLHHKGLGTMANSKRDFTGKPLTGEQWQQAKRLRMHQIRASAHDSTQQRLWQTLETFNRLAEFLEVPDVIAKQARDMMHRAIKMEVTHNWAHSYFSLAAIAWGYKMAGQPFASRKIVRKAELTANTYFKYYQKLRDVLKLEPPPQTTNDPYITEIYRQAGILKINRTVRDAAVQILELTRKLKLTDMIGARPSGIAAGLLYDAALWYGTKHKKVMLRLDDYMLASQLSAVTIKLARRKTAPAFEKFLEINNFKDKLRVYREAYGPGIL